MDSGTCWGRRTISWIERFDDRKKACRLGDAADRQAASWPSGRGAPELGRAPGAVRQFLFCRRLARAHERLRGHQRPGDLRLRQRDRLDRRRPRPRTQHVFCAVDGPRACRAVLDAVHGGAGAVARARTDLQGTARGAERQRSVVNWISWLSAAPDRRRGDVRRPPGAGWRRPGRASRARARGGAALQSFLRRRARGASAPADEDGAAAGARRRQKNEQESGQYDSAVGRRRNGEEKGALDVHGPEAHQAGYPRNR